MESSHFEAPQKPFVIIYMVRMIRLLKQVDEEWRDVEEGVTGDLF